MKKNILLLGFVFVILASMSLVCFGETARLIIVGGQMGGNNQLYGTAITEVVHRMYPEITIDYRPGAAVANVMVLSSGEADLGFSHNNNAVAATLGIEPFTEKYPGVMAIAGFNISKVQIVALKETGINSMRQIIDEKIPVRISVGDRGSGTELSFRRWMEVCGITYDDITSWGGKIYFKQNVEANDLMNLGQLDVQFNSGACPLPTFKELAANNDLNLLSVDEEVIETLNKKYGYIKTYITNEDYDFVTTDTPIFGQLSIVIVREAIPEEIVYKITKAIVENLDYFYAVDSVLESVTKENIWQDTGFDLHPGAKKYYQEIGVMK